MTSRSETAAFSSPGVDLRRPRSAERNFDELRSNAFRSSERIRREAGNRALTGDKLGLKRHSATVGRRFPDGTFVN
jgi:hypothetical protein